MADTPEGRVKAEIKAYLNALGAWYFMPVSKGYGRRGIPDFICCVRGLFVGIEAKAPGKKSDPWQTKEQQAIACAAGVAIEAHSAEEVKDVLEKVWGSKVMLDIGDNFS